MKAVLLNGYGSVDQLAYEEIPIPLAGAGEVLVKMASTSVNPIDYKIRRGDMKEIMPLQLPFIPGYDLAGQVVALGEGATSVKLDALVMGVTDYTYAEYVVCKAGILAPIPAGLELNEAGAYPLVLQTGAQLIERGVTSRSGVRLLITGALGSVGRVAVHVARKHGAYVIAGVRSSQRAEAEKLGVSEVVAVDDESQLNSLKELDAVADTVGREVIDRLIPHIRKNGVLATVVGKPESADGRDLQVNEVWSTSDPKRLQELAGELARGEFTLPISKRLKLADIRQAHVLAEKGAAGKIVITP
ncbi:MAG TPA: NADP-dependent oxidoreductase [Acidobacteriaceae bacterium]|nr:NADP-dependent oxidoreductase [Acidobacteriaceae bacterium]